jgi:hypothetical protein
VSLTDRPSRKPAFLVGVRRALPISLWWHGTAPSKFPPGTTVFTAEIAGRAVPA